MVDAIPISGPNAPEAPVAINIEGAGGVPTAAVMPTASSADPSVADAMPMASPADPSVAGAMPVASAADPSAADAMPADAMDLIPAVADLTGGYVGMADGSTPVLPAVIYGSEAGAGYVEIYLEDDYFSLVEDEGVDAALSAYRITDAYGRVYFAGTPAAVAPPQGMEYAYRLHNWRQDVESVGIAPPSGPAMQPTAFAVSEEAASGGSPEAMPHSADSTSPAPDAMVLPGEQPPSASGPVPDVEAVQIAHTTAVPNGQHTFVNVGSRAAAVTITLPPSPGVGQNVYVSDGSGQSDQYAVTVNAAAGHTIDEFTQYVLRNRYAVLHLRFDGVTNWKLL